MNIKEIIHQEIEKIPDFLLSEVLDHLRFLKSKHSHKNLEIT
jgi:predicted DNA-binding protein